MNPCLLTIIAPPELEESLIDWLLQQPQVSGFSTSHLDGHSSEHDPEKLSLLEQVTGRQSRVQVSIHLSVTMAETLLEGLKRDFARSGLHYTVVPVLAAGHL